MPLRLAAAALLASSIASPALAASPLAAHRAVYDIELEDASDRSGITGMSGRMVYDFGGSSCDGYTVSFRFVTRIDTEENSRITDQQTTTFEDVEAGVFQFATRSFVDQQQDRDVKGVAKEGGVALSAPEEREVELPEVAFPTQHTIELLEAARSGEQFFERMLFDGSEDADRALATTAIIGAPKTGAGKGDVLPDEFGGMRYWPVALAYYAAGDRSGETLPLYRIEMKLYENGVARDLMMDYGDFTLTGTLADLEMREGDAC